MNKPEDSTIERDIEEIGLVLAENVERPSPEFAEELGRRVRAGFPRERRRPAFPAFLRRPLPVAGALASVLIAVVIGVSLNGDNEGTTFEASDDRPASGGAEPGPMIGSGRLASPRSGSFAPGRRQKIERSVTLTLAAPADELDRVADQVVGITDRHRGFVLRSSVTTGDEGAPGGNFELRIPVAETRIALRELSALADVRARNQSGQDVTRQFASAREQLVTARAERRSLLRRLERADSDSEAESIRRRLDLVGGQIRSLRSSLRDLRLRTDYTTVTMTLEQSGDGGASGGFGETGEALQDALDSLAAVVNGVVRALGVLLPLGLLVGASWLGARALRRRRREAVLAE